VAEKGFVDANKTILDGAKTQGKGKNKMSVQPIESNTQRTIVVTGAQGVSGGAVLKRYAAFPGTTVYGVSRRPAESDGNVRHISVDLLNPDDVKAKLGRLHDTTHLFFGAYIDKQNAAEKSEVNVRILKNLLDALSEAPLLRHITIFQGGKAYGSDLGPYKTPAREDDPRLMSPNYYYDQEDLLRSRRKGSKWNFTVLRPGGAICGFALGSPLNLISVIGVYATICREMGLPLRFPGPEKVYRALYQVTSADLLARATVWAGETEAAQNEIFNVTNGDTLRWHHMWPRIAKMFGMDVTDPVPFSLSTYMADKGPVWDAIVKKQNLRPIPYEQIVSWGYGDFAFRQDFDNVSNTIKVRQAGFHDCIDSETMFAEIFDNLHETGILPSLSNSSLPAASNHGPSALNSQRKVS
jgi:nucleoside-diphosphate-sugar epimerase